MAASLERILIVGTGLLGASAGLALREAGFSGSILGWDKDPAQLRVAFERGAVTEAVSDAGQALAAAGNADLVLLCGPVYSILDWMQSLARQLHAGQLITDVGSTKAQITAAAEELFASPQRATFLPGHPMAGREISGAAAADVALFRGAAWIFTATPLLLPTTEQQDLALAWRQWVGRMGAIPIDLDPVVHDQQLAWTSHLPQFLATALAAELQSRLDPDPAHGQIGGRALREMPRLGSSPFSMWRDIAATNADAIAAALLAVEQRLAHIRENLRTPELREEFDRANRFRSRL